MSWSRILWLILQVVCLVVHFIRIISSNNFEDAKWSIIGCICAAIALSATLSVYINKEQYKDNGRYFD